MTPAQKQARDWIAEAVKERREALIEQWEASDDPAERETIHAKVKATIELEDELNGRIDRQVGE